MMSMKNTHTHASTFNGNPNLPRSKALGGKTLSLPRHARIPWGKTYDVVMKTIQAPTIEEKAADEPIKISPYNCALVSLFEVKVEPA